VPEENTAKVTEKWRKDLKFKTTSHQRHNKSRVTVKAALLHLYASNLACRKIIPVSYEMLTNYKNFTLEQTTKAQRGSSGVALLFL
jgi:hypothetical protein